MSGIRRRAPARCDERPKSCTHSVQSANYKLRSYHVAIIIGVILLLYFNRGTFSTPTDDHFNSHEAHSNSQEAQILDFSTLPDDEHAISSQRLAHEDYIPPSFRESTIVCMPSVTRTNVEYVSNSVKSFRLATRNSTTMRRILVFTMDDPPSEPTWLDNVFADRSATNELPSWLNVLPREGAVKQPRGTTLGDSLERVVWRSKEALDYAQVLERCVGATDAAWVIVVQDDVLFRPSINDVVTWAEGNIIDGARVINERRVARVCSGSLFDIDDAGSTDGDELQSSNMVARVWKRDDIDGWVKHFRQMYDDAPVDWLADRRCQRRRGWVPVMWPNPVRHRGKVSSFAKNQREGLLT